uniref:Uncharacterized protein n=1 Tax=Solanum tuberosum TaxID=4113 RepID=M1DDZ9_SOLTU
MAMVSPNIPVCQALKEKIKSAIEGAVDELPNSSAMQHYIAQRPRLHLRRPSAFPKKHQVWSYRKTRCKKIERLKFKLSFLPRFKSEIGYSKSHVSVIVEALLWCDRDVFLDIHSR